MRKKPKKLTTEIAVRRSKVFLSVLFDSVVPFCLRLVRVGQVGSRIYCKALRAAGSLNYLAITGLQLVRDSFYFRPHAQQIAGANFFNIRIGITFFQKLVNETGIIRHTFQAGRK